MSPSKPTPQEVLGTYESVASEFEHLRDKSLVEREWLDRLLGEATGPTVLDLGCGPGVPIARHLVDRGHDVTGVDGSKAMIEAFGKNIPEARAIVADMRGLALDSKFDALLAFDSFFHLSMTDQREMFPVFAQHLRQGGVLLINTGPEQGEAFGFAASQPIYHASLSPEEYRKLFVSHGFEIIESVLNDPSLQRALWLARRL